MTPSLLSRRTAMAPIAPLTAIGLYAQEQQPDYTFMVACYELADILEEQEAQGKTKPLLIWFRESRNKMVAEPPRPTYPYVNPEGRLNDPNGLSFWQGRWHLLNQAYPPEDPRQR